jgi:hypothetical protein
MTQDEIIEMARQADIRDSLEYDHMECDIESLEAFAKLVAQHERKRMAWTQGHWTEYEHNIASAEREACAKLCDALAVHPEYASEVTKLAAMAIRARGQA